MSAAPHTTSLPVSPRVNLLRELTMPLVLTAVVLYLLIGIFTMQVPANSGFPGPRFFPALICAALAVLVLIQTSVAVRSWRQGTIAVLGQRQPASPADGDLALEAPTRTRLNRAALLWVVGSFLGFALLLQLLGWILAAGLLFWGVAHAFGSRKPILDLVVGLTVSAAAYIGFDMLLGLALPSGLLGGGF